MPVISLAKTFDITTSAMCSTNFLGGQRGKVKADVRWLRLRDHDRLLLCSDGLNDMVDDASIARILGAHDQPPDAAQSLVDEAIERGGRDNVTVVVARYEVPTLRPVAERKIETHDQCLAGFHRLAGQDAAAVHDRISLSAAIRGRPNRAAANDLCTGVGAWRSGRLNHRPKSPVLE